MEFVVSLQPTDTPDIYALELTGDIHHFEALVSRQDITEQLAGDSDTVVLDRHEDKIYTCIDLSIGHIIVNTQFTHCRFVLGKRTVKSILAAIRAMVESEYVLEV